MSLLLALIGSPPAAVAINVPIPPRTPRRFGTRRGHVVTTITVQTAPSTAYVPEITTPRRRLPGTRRGRVTQTPTTVVVTVTSVWVPSPSRLPRRLAALRRRGPISTPLAAAAPVVVTFIPPVVSRRRTPPWARRRVQPVAPVVAVVYVPTIERRRSILGLRRHQASGPVVTITVTPATVPQPAGSTRRRGVRPIRGKVTNVPPAASRPPVASPAPRRVRGWRIWHGRFANVPLTQVAIPIIPTPTPAARIIVVAHDDRVLPVDRDDRVVVAPAPDGTVLIDHDDTVIVVAGPSRPGPSDPLLAEDGSTLLDELGSILYAVAGGTTDRTVSVDDVDQVIVVAFDDRIIVVDSDNRIVVVAFDDRMIPANPDDRIVVTIDDDRTAPEAQ